MMFLLLGDRLLSQGSTPIEVQQSLATAAERREALRSLLDKDPLKELLPSPGCPREGGLPGPYDNPNSDSIASMAMSSVLEAVEQSWMSDINYFVPSLYEITTRRLSPDDAEYDPVAQTKFDHVWPQIQRGLEPYVQTCTRSVAGVLRDVVVWSCNEHPDNHNPFADIRRPGTPKISGRRLTGWTNGDAYNFENQNDREEFSDIIINALSSEKSEFQIIPALRLIMDSGFSSNCEFLDADGGFNITMAVDAVPAESKLQYKEYSKMSNHESPVTDCYLVEYTDRFSNSIELNYTEQFSENFKSKRKECRDLNEESVSLVRPAAFAELYMKSWSDAVTNTYNNQTHPLPEGFLDNLQAYNNRLWRLLEGTAGDEGDGRRGVGANGAYEYISDMFMHRISLDINSSRFFEAENIQALHDILTQEFLTTSRDSGERCLYKNEYRLDFEKIKEQAIKRYKESLCLPENSPVSRDFDEPGPLEKELAKQMVVLFIQTFVTEFLLKGLFVFSMYEPEPFLRERVIVDYLEADIKRKIETLLPAQEKLDFFKHVKEMTNESDINTALITLIKEILTGQSAQMKEYVTKVMAPKYGSFKEKLYNELANKMTDVPSDNRITSPQRRGMVPLAHKYLDSDSNLSSDGILQLNQGNFYAERYFKLKGDLFARIFQISPFEQGEDNENDPANRIGIAINSKGRNYLSGQDCTVTPCIVENYDDLQRRPGISTNTYRGIFNENELFALLYEIYQLAHSNREGGRASFISTRVEEDGSVVLFERDRDHLYVKNPDPGEVNHWRKILRDLDDGGVIMGMRIVCTPGTSYSDIKLNSSYSLANPDGTAIDPRDARNMRDLFERPAADLANDDEDVYSPYNMRHGLKPSTFWSELRFRWDTENWSHPGPLAEEMNDLRMDVAYHKAVELVRHNRCFIGSTNHGEIDTSKFTAPIGERGPSPEILLGAETALNVGDFVARIPVGNAGFIFGAGSDDSHREEYVPGHPVLCRPKNLLFPTPVARIEKGIKCLFESIPFLQDPDSFPMAHPGNAVGMGLKGALSRRLITTESELKKQFFGFGQQGLDMHGQSHSKITTPAHESVRHLFDDIFPLDRYQALYLLQNNLHIEENENINNLMDPTRGVIVELFRSLNDNDPFTFTSPGDNATLYNALATGGTSGGMDISLAPFLKGMLTSINRLASTTVPGLIRGQAAFLDPGYIQMKEKYDENYCNLPQGLTWGSIGPLVDLTDPMAAPNLTDGINLSKTDEGAFQEWWTHRFSPINIAAPRDLVMAMAFFFENFSGPNGLGFEATLPLLNVMEHIVGSAGVGNHAYGRFLGPAGMIALSVPELPGESRRRRSKSSNNCEPRRPPLEMCEDQSPRALFRDEEEED